MTAGVVDKDLIHVEVKKLPEETAAFCSLIMGKTHKSLMRYILIDQLILQRLQKDY